MSKCDWCEPGHEICGTCKKFFDYFGDGTDKCSADFNDPDLCSGYDPNNYCPNCGRKLRIKMATEKRLIDANECPTVDAVEVPCKIGDFVWAIRNFKGKKHPQRGVVSEMFFNKRMELIIVVKYVARGKWGETIFATDKEAYAAIEERKTDA